MADSDPADVQQLPEVNTDANMPVTPDAGGEGSSFEEVEYVEEVVYEEVEEGEENDDEQVEQAAVQPQQQQLQHQEQRHFQLIQETEQPQQQQQQTQQAPKMLDEHPALSPEQEGLSSVKDSEFENVVPEQSDSFTVDSSSEQGFQVVTAQATDIPQGPPPAAASPEPTNFKVDMEIRQLEERAQKVARDVQEAARVASKKLTAGFMSAFGTSSFGGTSSEPAAASTPTISATASLSKLAGGFSSWLSALDTVAKPEVEIASAKSSQDVAALAGLFGLKADEHFVEEFRCKLVQTYECSHNIFTSSVQVVLPGTLYITDGHVCMVVEEKGKRVPFKIDLQDIRGVQRHTAVANEPSSDVLHIELGVGRYLDLRDFAAPAALDSAHALIDHLRDSVAGAGGAGDLALSSGTGHAKGPAVELVQAV